MSIQLERTGPVAVITHDDGKANTHNPAFLAELVGALDEVESDDAARALVITGRPRFFSAGLDLKLLPTLERDELIEFTDAYLKNYGRLYAFPKPVVCGATGHAIAGGAVLLLCGDVRIGSTGRYKTGLTEVAVGIPLPPVVALLGSSALIPSAHTSTMLHGSSYGPDDALKLGFYTELADEEQVLDRARAAAARLAMLPDGAYRATKEVLRGAPMRALMARQEASRFYSTLVEAGILTE